MLSRDTRAQRKLTFLFLLRAASCCDCLTSATHVDAFVDAFNVCFVIGDQTCRIIRCSIVKVGTHEGTSPCNKLQGQVPSCELVIFA